MSVNLSFAQLVILFTSVVCSVLKYERYLSLFSKVSLKRDYVKIPSEAQVFSNTLDFSQLENEQQIEKKGKAVYVAEVVALVDTAMADQIGHESKINDFLTSFWDDVDALYATIDEPLINIKLVGKVVIRKQEDEPYIQNNILSNGKVHGPSMMEDFGKWIYNNANIQPHDIAFLHTRRQISGEEKHLTLAGISYFEGVCSRLNSISYGVSVGNAMDYSYDAVVVAAHEIAHNMYVPHDGQELEGTGDCSISDGYIMTTSVSGLKVLNFSECSKNEMRKHFKESKSYCLRADNVNSE